MVNSTGGAGTPGFSIDLKAVEKLLVLTEQQEKLQKRLESLIENRFPGVKISPGLGGFDFSGPKHQVDALKAVVEQITKVGEGD